MTDLNLTARRDGSDFRLFCNGIEFGRLSYCEVNYVYEGQFWQDIAQNWEGDFSVREMLAHVRKSLEAATVARKGEFSAEAWGAEGMRLVGVGTALGLPRVKAEGHRIVEQACSAMRVRPA